MKDVLRPTVFVVGGATTYMEMFDKEGWQVVDEFDQADLIQFTGGEDVSPHIYGQMKHATTHHNPARDRLEAVTFKLAKALDRPMAGICRGGQFLNVMCGGSMWQHVNNHAIADTHAALDEGTGEIFSVTSTHHQMMDPDLDRAELLLWATEASFREKQNYGQHHPYRDDTPGLLDVEACFYPIGGGVLCFQPHPEYRTAPLECRDLYFRYLWDLFNLGIVDITEEDEVA